MKFVKFVKYVYWYYLFRDIYENWRTVTLKNKNSKYKQNSQITKINKDTVIQIIIDSK